MSRFYIFLTVLFCASLVASDKSRPKGKAGKKSRISVVLVNQPSVRKITFEDKVHKLPMITLVFPPYTDQTVVTKSYPNGKEEELFMYQLPLDLLTSISILDQDIAATGLRGIVNVTPRYTILYKKCLAIFKRLIKIEFKEQTEKPRREFQWYHLW